MKVCALADVPDGRGHRRRGRRHARSRSCAAARTVFALNDVCSHAEVSLSEGEVYDGTIECWLHGSCFDLRTGKPTNPPATQPVAAYRSRSRTATCTCRLRRD